MALANSLHTESQQQGETFTKVFTDAACKRNGRPNAIAGFVLLTADVIKLISLLVLAIINCLLHSHF